MKSDKNKKIAIIYGNCTTEVYYTILKRIESINKAFELHYFPVEELRKTEINVRENIEIRNCDFFIMQKGHLQFPAFFDDIPSKCQTLSFPVIVLGSLWPFYRTDSRNKPEPDRGFPFGKYPYGDKKVIALLEKGLTGQEVFDEYMKLNIADHIDLDEYHHRNLFAGTELEKKCDLKIYDYIEEYFVKKRLLYTIDHPTPDLILYQVEQILKEVTGEVIPESEKSIIREYAPLKYLQVPIHPQVIEHYKLEWINSDDKYEYGNNFLSFRDYYYNYINFY